MQSRAVEPLAYLRSIVLLFTVDALLCSCSSGPDAAMQTRQTYRTSISSLEAGAYASNMEIVLYDPQFFDPDHDRALLKADVYPVGATYTARWASDSSSVVTQVNEPDYSSSASNPAPTAPPHSIFVGVGQTYGKSNVSLFVGSPVFETAKVSILHLPSISLGCTFRFYPAFNFTNGNIAAVPVTLGIGADIYETTPENGLTSLDPCYKSVLSSSKLEQETWHVPYGGTLVATKSLSDFLAIDGDEWRADDVRFTATDGGSTLLFKTREGLLVKALLPIGPVQVSDYSGHFQT